MEVEFVEVGKMLGATPYLELGYIQFLAPNPIIDVQKREKYSKESSFPIFSSTRYSQIAVTMPLRRRARRKTSPHDPTEDNARLLPAIGLQDHRIDVSRSIHNFSKLDDSSSEEGDDIISHESLPHKRLQRVATPLRLGRCMDALKRCAKKHSGSQRVIVQVWDERVRSHSCPETSPGECEKKCGSWRNCKIKVDSHEGLRSTIKWYYWSPSSTVKNCSTLEFVRTCCAAPSMWL